MDDVVEDQIDSQAIASETPANNVFIPPSIDEPHVLTGESYTYHSPIPKTIADDMSIPCVLGVDEAGRGPVLGMRTFPYLPFPSSFPQYLPPLSGPMVYALHYLPLSQHRSLLAETYHFDDSKVLTPAFRSTLMARLCTPPSDLHAHTGWATRLLSARDISAAQLRPFAPYNLNAQAMDATISLIQDVLDSGVNVREIYIDTIGPPATYQRRLERIFPAQAITVAKKADSLYPCVSAASVCAKVTRDAALEVLWRGRERDRVQQQRKRKRTEETGTEAEQEEEKQEQEEEGKEKEKDGAMEWGSGYPSDARCSGWLKRNMDPVFGWGNECRYSWGTAKALLEEKGAPCEARWPEADDGDGSENMKLTGFLLGSRDEERGDELGSWFGRRVTDAVF
nr:ribonuclease h2 subunit a [Quercus suber]